MAVENFDGSLSRVLKHEGGWSNHPADPGGATMQGITQRVYSAYRKARGKPDQSVRYIADVELREIYRRDYWDAVRADELPAGVDYCAFDAAVNSGPGRAAKWLQRAVAVTPDGVIGPLTLKAARELPASITINRMCDDRLAFLKSLPTWETFGKGWTRRVEGVRKEALAMASAAPAPPPPDIEPPPEPPAPPARSGGLFATLLSLLKRIFT